MRRRILIGGYPTSVVASLCHLCRVTDYIGLYEPLLSCRVLDLATRRNLATVAGRHERSRRRHIAIVGAGPAGFYAAQHLTKKSTTLVDIYEQLPTPYGLVRHGVAPDHPDVKNVISTFERTALLPSVRLLGDVTVGDDVSVTQLLAAYDAVVLAYGAAGVARRLPVSGARRLRNVVSARQLVAWYNGEPTAVSAKRPVDLRGVESAVVVGVGNVALDVLRMLTTDVTQLATTDMPAEVVEHLRAATSLRRVTLVARRGALHVAFTTRELREQLAVPGWRADWSCLQGEALECSGATRARRRLTETMIKAAAEQSQGSVSSDCADCRWTIRFWRRPLEYLGVDRICNDAKSLNDSGSGDESSENNQQELPRVTGVRLAGTGENFGDGECDTGETLPCQLVVESVGYRGVNIDNDLIPFDSDSAIVRTTNNGRVSGVDGLYACGWIATGPVGVIATTMTNSFTVARQVLADLDAREDERQLTSSPDEVLETLARAAVRPVTFSDWQRLDREEVERGKRMGKVREKVISLDEMRKIIWT